MFSKIALAVIVGVLVIHLVSYFIYAHERTIASANTFAAALTERALTIDRLSREHPELVSLLTSPGFALTHTATPPVEPERSWPHTDEVRQTVLAILAQSGFSPLDAVFFFVAVSRGEPVMTLALPNGDGRWLQVSARMDASAWRRGAGALWLTMVSLAVLGAVLWGTRRVTRRLPQFVAAAEALGNTRAVTELPVSGPAEIQRLSRAFNRMQHRIRRYTDERSAMLGAVSHDLRTFVTRLKLRTEYIDNPEQRRKADQDIESITRILDEALAFARDEQSDELPVTVDLATMLTSLVDDETDLGCDASYRGPDHLAVAGQPTALRRAFQNLARNALRYGGSLEVRLAPQPDTVIVEFNDPGPGIPPERQADMLKPYVRGEPSRNRASGGTGLGLAVAANVIQRHGGTLSFRNRPDGFTVLVALPHGTGASGDDRAGGTRVNYEVPSPE